MSQTFRNNMKLLVFTQKIDNEDPVLGFFHDWVKNISERVESVEVICIQKGKNALPTNVHINEIGKQIGIKKLSYIFRVYYFLFQLRGKYDSVFVHMNQEYVFSLGPYWKFKNTPVYLWRNHSKGNWITRIAVFLSTKVFCTSKSSFTARFKKTVIMPAGIDTSIFVTNPVPSRKKYSICMVGRISPVKHVDMGIQAVKELIQSGVQVSLAVIGPVPEKDKQYYEGLKKYVEQNSLGLFVSFLPAVQYANLPAVFNEYQICLNLTDTGSFDKTIVEAAACGAIPLTTNSSMGGLLPDDCVVGENIESVKRGVKNLLDDHVRLRLENDLEKFAKSQSLDSLLSKLLEEFGNV